MLALLGAFLAHISVNTLNEYFDFKSGLDLETIKTPFSGGSGADFAAAHGVLSISRWNCCPSVRSHCRSSSGADGPLTGRDTGLTLRCPAPWGRPLIASVPSHFRSRAFVVLLHFRLTGGLE